MQELFAAVDAQAASWLSPCFRIVVWGALNAALCMALYRYTSPQQKIVALKSSHKDSRRALLSYDGDFDGLMPVVMNDLKIAFTRVAVVFIPFMLSLIPLFIGMYYLAPMFTGQYIDFGPDWMRGFEFVFITTVIIASLAIKFTFDIA